MRKPALTKAVMSALALCITHAEAVVNGDDITPNVGHGDVERASKWHRAMVEWRASKQEVKP